MIREEFTTVSLPRGYNVNIKHLKPVTSGTYDINTEEISKG